MNIQIEYCTPCGYGKRADAVAAALQERFGVAADLVPGKGGVFRVYVNGKEVIARTRGYFPSPEEIVAAVGSHGAGGRAASGTKLRAKGN